MATTPELTMFRGEDQTFPFVIRETSSSSSAVVDITGWTFVMTVARDKNRADKVFEAAGTIDSAVAGTMHVPVPKALTESVAPGRYYYDLWRTNSGSERVAAIGDFQILPNVRRP